PADDLAGDRPARPRAVPGAGPAAQVATVAAAVVVLLVVGIVLALQDAKEPPRSRPGPDAQPTVTEVPPPPPSTAQPTVDPTLAPEDPTVPASLCPDLEVQHPITVLAFNIHGGLTHGRRVELDRVAREIRAWNADVVLLQEVDDHRRRSGFARQAQVLGGLTDLSWVYGPNHRRPDGGPIGNAILTRHEVKDWQNILLPRAGGKEQRGLLHAVLDVDGVEISVYSTHFDHRSSAARKAQARAAVAQIRKDGRPTILGGDLNATSGSDTLRTLRSIGLGDAWAVGEGPGHTAPARRPRHRIDFVLHDGWFTPVQSAVLYSAVSDHRAVWTRLELREEIGCIDVGG
ncbi:endonuclease/exonuclease/phosphatase family protein, partial [Nocardioides sp. SYSU DS0651]|uniref:endonuclease/exonuclease/phosphatase family protein n=1 Tax=Nocardioides sp. SYSU DS0651 TaxID=3415955 RepID=UPI003F4BFDAC